MTNHYAVSLVKGSSRSVRTADLRFTPSTLPILELTCAKRAALEDWPATYHLQLSKTTRRPVRDVDLMRSSFITELIVVFPQVQDLISFLLLSIFFCVFLYIRPLLYLLQLLQNGRFRPWSLSWCLLLSALPSNAVLFTFVVGGRGGLEHKQKRAF